MRVLWSCSRCWDVFGSLKINLANARVCKFFSLHFLLQLRPVITMTTSVRLQRSQGQSWGIRLHGGKDFHQPLIVLKVTANSIASQNGLSPGDTVLKINGQDTATLTHKMSEDLIKNAGNSVELVVVKMGTTTWKPQVTMVNNENDEVRTRTSLAKQSQSGCGSGGSGGSGINNMVKPFRTTTQSGQVLVNKQFNTPINMYSDQSIAETLSAQAEVLAGGAIGVNFKKNEKKYNYENSEVYKMLQEVESDHQDESSFQQQQSPAVDRVVGGVMKEVKIPPVVGQGVQQERQQVQQRIQQQQMAQQAAQQKAAMQAQQQQAMQQQQQAQAQQSPGQGQGQAQGLPPGSNICAECERLIVGVFVRIKEKNLHVDCFKCATCGQSLKNVGYFNINNKLYCDIHAKTVARQQTAGPPSVSPKIKPFSYTPGQFGTPSATPPVSQFTGQPSQQFGSPLGQHSPGVMAPMPFHGGGTMGHVAGPKSPQMSMQMQPMAPMQPLGGQGQGSGSSYQQSSSFESFQKSSSSTYESSTMSSGGGGSKVVWPPLDGDIPISTLGGAAASAGGQKAQQSKFKQQHVPYQPLSTLLAPAGRPQQFAPAPSFAPQQQFAQAPAPQFAPAPAPSQQQFSPAPAPTPAPQQFAPQNYAAPPQAPQQTPPLQQPIQTFAPFKPAPQPSFVPPPFTPSSPSAPSAAAAGKASSNILANRIGRGILNQPSARVAICGGCQKQIRGPFVSAGVKFYCPDHFKCANSTCKRDLMDVGFVEEKGQLYCEFCWESHIAPVCAKCSKRVKYECLKAIGKDFHTACFCCKQCGKQFGKDPYFLEDGEAYCQMDWNEMFTTKCFGCGFPIEAGDKWVEAMNNNYHSQCFNCSACKKNLEGQSFFAKAGRPFCKSHAR